MMPDDEMKEPATDTGREAALYTQEEPATPSLWGSVLHAFRRARLARLEARVRRLRRCAVPPPVVYDRRTVVVPAERPHTQSDSDWTPASARGPGRRLWATAAVGMVAVTGITLSLPRPRTSGVAAEALTEPPRETRVAAEPIEELAVGTTLATVDGRLTALRHQVEQQGDQLTNQAAAVMNVSQQTDTQHSQLTTLAEALAAVTAQVRQLEQHLATQATRVTAHETQLATQATRLGQLREATGATPVTRARHSRPGPPTLELLAPPTLELLAPPPAASPAPAPGAASSAPAPRPPTPRRTITLPASLGAVGLRNAAGDTGGPRP